MRAKHLFIGMTIVLILSCAKHIENTALTTASKKGNEIPGNGVTIDDGGILPDGTADRETRDGQLEPYAWSLNSWANTNISVSFMPDGSYSDAGTPNNLFAYLNAIAPTAVWQREYARALQSWANSSTLNFHFVPDSGDRWATSQIPQGDSRFGDIRIGGYVGSQGLAHAFYPPGGDQFLRTNIASGICGSATYYGPCSNWLYGSASDLYSIVMHEFGHGIGLAHSSVAAVMSGSPCTGWGVCLGGLMADDIAGVQAIYGARQPDAYDATAANNTLSTATSLTLSSGAISLKADITTLGDVDYYEVVSPSSFDGTLSVTVDPRALSLFAPKVSVLDSLGNLLKSSSVDLTYGYGKLATLKLSGLMPNQNYYIGVSGATYDPFGMGAYQLFIQFGPVVVNAPSGLTAIRTTRTYSNEVALSWSNNAPSLTHFQMERSEDGVNFTPIALRIVGNGPNLIDVIDTYVVYNPNYSVGKTFYYRVRAVSGDALSSASNVISVMIPPRAPYDLVATAISSNEIDLSWNHSGPTPSGFRVYRSNGLIATLPADARSYKNLGLSANTAYYYVVSAYNSAGETKSDSFGAPTPPGGSLSVPTGLSAMVNSYTVSLSWNSSDGATGYRIYRNGTQIGTSSVTSYSDMNVAPGNYNYTISAYDGSGDMSAQPSPISITVKDITAPSIPTGLYYTVDVSRVNLRWTWSTDNVDVTGYSVYRNGTLIATLVTRCTTQGCLYQDYGVSPSTTYLYTVAAFDAAGNISAKSAPLSVTLPGSSDTTAPTVSISSPASGIAVSGPVAISANASDNVAVYKVDFYVDGSLIGSDSSSPYSVSWDSTKVSNGSHTLLAKAYDAAGNVGTSASVVINVSNVDTAAPVVSITSPASGSFVSRRTTVTISANASDNVGVARVEIYVNNSLICTDTASPYSCNWSVPGGKAGKSYQIQAKAYDAAGNVGSSAIISVRAQ